MKDKYLGALLLIATFTGITAMAFDGGTTVDFANGLYTIAGFLWYIFGTWAGIRLLKD